MPQPDWAKVQKTDEKSQFHGKKDKDHGPQEHPGGAKEEHPTGKGLPFLRAAGFDLPAGVTYDTTEEELEQLAGGTLVSFPSPFNIPFLPPHTNQGTTPTCVCHSSGADQNQQDRDESGKFFDFDEAKFFTQIGGTSQGASMSKALQQRVDFGYPTIAGGDRDKHRIKAFVRIDNTVTAFKSAIYNRKHGVLRIGPYYHSWMHPLASGKLPAPDYVVFWHALFFAGYNDNLGARLRQSWGTSWGPINGDAFMPYPYLIREGYMWITTDR